MAAKVKRIPLRSEIDVADTWDLRPLYASDAAWQRAFRRIERRIPGFVRFRGKLGRSARTLRACLDSQMELDQQLERLGSYAFLRSSEDVGHSAGQDMLSRATWLATRFQEAVSFLPPEIRAIPRARMRALLQSPLLADYRFHLQKLLRYRSHILSPQEERILAMQGEVADSVRRIFGQLNDADLKFGEIKNDRGETVELSHASFRSLLESRRRSVRKRAFQQFYAQYKAHANTLAASLSASVLQDVYTARARNYSSALHAALFADNVPVAVYDTLIETVRDNLATVYRYLDLRRRVLRLPNLHFYDNYVPIVAPAQPVHIPYTKAVEQVIAALAPLGDAYCRSLEGGLNGRWVDRYENRGKRSGAFSAGGYIGPPYILLNYQPEVQDSVFTLAHEAGHSMHTWYSAQHQPYQYYGYSIFVAEVASTFNEQLLSHHLLRNATSKRERALLLSREIDEIRGTLVRQTMFAEYEKVIHEACERGESLTLERLLEEYRKLLVLYFGNGMVLDEELALEGLRIPHFYHAFYVYKYATGLSAAIALAQGVLAGGRKARDRYLRFLAGGGSKYPLDLLRDAGVDMTSPEPVRHAMAHFATLVDQLEELVEANG